MMNFFFIVIRMFRNYIDCEFDSSDCSDNNSDNSSYTSDDERPCRKNPQRNGRTFSSDDDEQPCCRRRIRCNHRQCCFCGTTDKSIVEPRDYPSNKYSVRRFLLVKSVSPGQRSNRKRQLRYENYVELMRKHGNSIRHGTFGPQILDPKSGLWRHFNDRGRTGKKGETWIDSTSKKGKKIRRRCPITCKICHGCSPGCFLQKRKEERRRITEEYEMELQTLKSKNALLLRKINMIRMLVFVKHQIWTISSKLQKYRFPVEFVSNQNHGFSLYDNGEIVKEKSFLWSGVISLDFQNRIDLWKNSTWRQEKKCVILSALQKRRQLCAGGFGKLFLEKLIPNSLPFFRMFVLKKLFGNSSIRREGFVEDLELRP
jgi:hypothetical protein